MMCSVLVRQIAASSFHSLGICTNWAFIEMINCFISFIVGSILHGTWVPPSAYFISLVESASTIGLTWIFLQTISNLFLMWRFHLYSNQQWHMVPKKAKINCPLSFFNVPPILARPCLLRELSSVFYINCPRFQTSKRYTKNPFQLQNRSSWWLWETLSMSKKEILWTHSLVVPV